MILIFESISGSGSHLFHLLLIVWISSKAAWCYDTLWVSRDDNRVTRPLFDYPDSHSQWNNTEQHVVVVIVCCSHCLWVAWITKYAVTIPLNYSVTLEKVVELFHSYLMGPRTHYDIGHAWFKSYCFTPSVASVWYSAIRNNIYWRQAVRQNFQLARTGSGSHPASYSVDTWESTTLTAVLPHSDQDTARPLSTALAYLLTYSMVQSPSWEANWFAASPEIPRI